MGGVGPLSEDDNAHMFFLVSAYQALAVQSRR